MITQPRVKSPTKGFKLRTDACARCDKVVQLMCTDRCAAGRAVLCEIQTEEEKQADYGQE